MKRLTVTRVLVWSAGPMIWAGLIALWIISH